jgi:hypothetical protein
VIIDGSEATNTLYYYDPGPKMGNPTTAYPIINAPYLTSIESNTPINNFL